MQQRLSRPFIVCLTFILLLAPGVMASQLIEGKLASKLLPQPVEYNVLLPDGYEAAKEPLPLLFFLHGGGGDRSFLTRSRSIFDEMWKAGTLPPLVVVTPSAGRSFYMDYKDGSERWETFVVTDFLNHLRAKFNVTKERQGTLVMGISMGGMGALRFGFKYPEKFAALAALEPGIDPALKWKDVKPRNRFYRGQDLMETIFGKPLDEAWWEANNAASIAVAKADKLRAANLGIYLEVGDEDSFNLHEAAEFLHRILWDQQIKHEYHLVRGADHVGRTMRGRIIEGLSFLTRTLKPPPPDPEAENLKQRLAPLKKQWGVPER